MNRKLAKPRTNEGDYLYRSFKKDLGIEQYSVPFYNSLEALLTSGIEFDVLCIATPNGFHAEHALMGLEYKKHVVIEKPMALNKADCEKIIIKSLQVSKQVFCVMQNRYSPPSEWIKSIIEENDKRVLSFLVGEIKRMYGFK